MQNNKSNVVKASGYSADRSSQKEKQKEVTTPQPGIWDGLKKQIADKWDDIKNPFESVDEWKARKRKQGRKIS